MLPAQKKLDIGGFGIGGSSDLAAQGVLIGRWNFEPDWNLVVGCSMGALIGGFHAAGKLAAYEAKEVWLSRGDLFDAIRASIAIPGIFTPKMSDGRTLVDGGLLNPLPVAPATDHTTDLTIAVSLSGRDVSEPLGPNPLPIRSGSIEAYRSRIEGFIGTVQNKLGIEHTVEQTQEREIPLTDVLMGMFTPCNLLFHVIGSPLIRRIF